MEEGEIITGKIVSPKSDVIEQEEISQAQEKGTEDEKVAESVKGEDGEVQEKVDDVKDEGELVESKGDGVRTESEDGEIPNEVQDGSPQKQNFEKGFQEMQKEDGQVEGGLSKSTVTEEVDEQGEKGIEEERGSSNDLETKKQEDVVDIEEGEIGDEPMQVVGGDDVQIEGKGEIDDKKAAEDDDGEIKDELDDKKGEEDEDGEITEELEKTEDGDITHADKVSLPCGEESSHLVQSDGNNNDKQGAVELVCGGETQKGTTFAAPDTTETEEGELDDDDDKETGKMNAERPMKPAPAKDEVGEKNIASRIEFGMDEARPEDEQLDYDEDELEDKTKSAPYPNAQAEQLKDVKSDGEVDSASDGEIKSDGDGAEFEEGETRDHPMDLPPEQKKICKFFEMGNCTWGDRCRYLHPGVNDKGNYDMFADAEREGRRPPPHFPPGPPHSLPPPGPFWHEPPPPFLPPPPPVAETAWEKGLRHAKEMKRRAFQRKVQEPDFLQKREVLSLNHALNEDHDMEFVGSDLSAQRSKGFDPFEHEADEYAVPTPEEARRALARDRRRPPPPQRHPHDKDRRPPPPEHMLPPDMRRDRRPISPREHQGPGRFPMDMRRLSPRRENERDRRPNFPPNGPGLIRRDIDRRERRDFPERPEGRGHFPPDANRRDIPPDRVRDEKFPDGGKGDKRLQNGAPVGQSQQWNDPWARGRPQTKGRNNKNASSSSSGSSTGSSSRSSSRSSGSSHSSLSGSSRSSSRSSASSRSSSYSSDRDSSRSPSPSKNSKPKKKVLSSAKQRNAATGAVQKKPLTTSATKLPPPKPVPHLKTEAADGTEPKPVTISGKKPLEKKPPGATNAAKPPVAAKKPAKPKKPESSSSSEFSRSSDSSPSPSRTKAKSGSNSDSGSSSSSSSMSSSSGSSSSDSDEGDKPAKRRKAVAKPSHAPKGQIPPSATVKPSPFQQQNKGKVMVPSKPGRKDVKMTIIDKPGAPKKRTAAEMTSQQKKPSSRRTELLEQLRVVEDAIARKRAKLT